MNRQTLQFVLTGIALAAVFSMLPGCSVFEGSRAIDMTPFSENTSVMFAEAAKVSRPFRFVYLKPYINIPEASDFRQRGTPLMGALRGIVMYSNQVVALNMADKE